MKWTEFDSRLFFWCCFISKTWLFYRLSLVCFLASEDGKQNELNRVWLMSVFLMLRYAARWDCGAKFQLVVRLLDKHEKEVDSFEREVVITDAALRKIWHKVHSFYLSFTPCFGPGVSRRRVLQAVFTLCLCCGRPSLKGGEGHHQSDKHGNCFGYLKAP